MKLELVLALFCPAADGMQVLLDASGQLPQRSPAPGEGLGETCRALATSVGATLASELVDAGFIEDGDRILMLRTALASAPQGWALVRELEPVTVQPPTSHRAAMLSKARQALSSLLQRQPVCAVVGCKATSRHYSDDVQARAIAAGRMAADLGFAVLTGGLGGVMSDAACGARQAGGPTIGILPGEAHRDANPHARFVLPSGIGYARNYLVALGCDCMVALPGGRGTLEEMCFALDFERLVLSWGSFTVDEAESIAPTEPATIAARLDAWICRSFSEAFPTLEPLSQAQATEPACTA